jgi:hypothetical protein
MQPPKELQSSTGAKSMIDDNSKPEKTQSDSNAHQRREFLKKVGKGSVTVPAAVLLLAASTKQGKAQPPPSGGCTTAHE